MAEILGDQGRAAAARKAGKSGALKLIWLAWAVSDLIAVRSYIAETSPVMMRVVEERIRSAVEQLRDEPELGRPRRVGNARELAVPGTPFSVAYRVLSRQIEILAVIHVQKPWPDSVV